MLNSIFMLSKYLKKTVTTALILGLMISPILPATQSISSSISIAAQAAEIEVQLEEAQASTGEWSEYANTAWYYDNQNENENEYTITTAEELAGLAKLVNDGTCNFEGKTIKLADNIDLGAHYWVPIGVDTIKPFMGSFDGQGYTISNMHIGTSEAPSDYEYAGLFGVVRANREATNVTIANVNIGENSWVYTSDDDHSVSAGGICAYADAYADPEDNVNATLTIINCSNSAGISSSTNGSYKNANAGGICARACNIKLSSVTVSNCSNSGTITASSQKAYNAAANAGGICGTGQSLTIINCSNSAEISAYSRKSLKAGGICGSNLYSTVSNCYYKEGAAARGIGMEGDQLGKTTALPEDQMTAATGTMDEDWVDITIDGNSKGEMALVDALSTWVQAYNATNPSVKALDWEVTTGNYPTLNPNQNIASTETNTATDANAPADEGANTAIDIATDAPADEGANVVIEVPADGNVNDAAVDEVANALDIIRGDDGLYYTTAADGTLTLINGEFEVDAGIAAFNNGIVLYDTWYMCVDGIVRYIDANGIIDNSIEGRIENGASDYTYYYNNNIRCNGFIVIGSKQYYFNNGQMVRGGFYSYSIGNGTYVCYINNSGEILPNFIGTFDAEMNTFIYTYNGQLCSGAFTLETGVTYVFNNGIILQ